MSGLAQRPYRLHVLESDSLSHVLSDPIDGGDLGAEIKLSLEALHNRIAGRVLTESGRPIPGVDVRLERASFATRARFFGGITEVGIVDSREAVKTDAQGRFLFRRIPAKGMRSNLSSEAIIPMNWEIPEDLDLENHTIVADALCHLQVSLANSGFDADGVSAITGDGERIPLSLIREGSSTSRSIYPLAGGKTPVLSVSSRARTLRFPKGSTVIHETSIDLLPGEVTQVRRR